MENQVLQIAERIRGLRDIMSVSQQEMAQACDVSLEEYIACEEGRSDFSFTFLYKCAARLGVDITELLTGMPPRLSGYTVTRAGEGLPIKRRAGLNYENMAFLFRNKLAEPYVVTVPYREEEQNQPIHMTVHEYQEFDYVLDGTLRYVHNGHEEILRTGDSVYYDSREPHGLIAIDGKDAKLLAVVIRRDGSNV